MDNQRFDRLARRLASGASRRSLLGAVAAGLAGGVLGRGMKPEPAAAQGWPPCESGIVCLDQCCPPEAVGCATEIDYDVPVVWITCQCPVTYEYRDGECVYAGPVAADDSATVSWNSSVDIDVLANDAGPGIEAVGASNPAHGAVTGGPNGTITYTPDPDFQGIDWFAYQITDTYGQTDIAEVRVIVVGGRTH